jgi:hypothetical protein
MDERVRMGTIVGTILNEFKNQHSKHLDEKCSWEVDFLLRYLDREKIIGVDYNVALESLQRAHFNNAFPDHFKLIEKDEELILVWDPTEKILITNQSKSKSYVYFISSSDGYVKIGSSTNPEARLKNLQTATHHLLQLVHVIPGNENIEKYLHRLFVSDHVRGEWFKFSEVIMDFIKFNFVSNKKEVPSSLEAFFE